MNASTFDDLLHGFKDSRYPLFPRPNPPAVLIPPGEPPLTRQHNKAPPKSPNFMPTSRNDPASQYPQVESRIEAVMTSESEYSGDEADVYRRNELLKRNSALLELAVPQRPKISLAPASIPPLAPYYVDKSSMERKPCASSSDSGRNFIPTPIPPPVSIIPRRGYPRPAPPSVRSHTPASVSTAEREHGQPTMRTSLERDQISPLPAQAKRTNNEPNQASSTSRDPHSFSSPIPIPTSSRNSAPTTESLSSIKNKTTHSHRSMGRHQHSRDHSRVLENTQASPLPSNSRHHAALVSTQDTVVPESQLSTPRLRSKASPRMAHTSAEAKPIPARRNEEVEFTKSRSRSFFSVRERGGISPRPDGNNDEKSEDNVTEKDVPSSLLQVPPATSMSRSRTPSVATRAEDIRRPSRSGSAVRHQDRGRIPLEPRRVSQDVLSVDSTEESNNDCDEIPYPPSPPSQYPTSLPASRSRSFSTSQAEIWSVRKELSKRSNGSRPRSRSFTASSTNAEISRQPPPPDPTLIQTSITASRLHPQASSSRNENAKDMFRSRNKDVSELLKSRSQSRQGFQSSSNEESEQDEILPPVRPLPTSRSRSFSSSRRPLFEEEKDSQRSHRNDSTRPRSRSVTSSSIAPQTKRKIKTPVSPLLGQSASAKYKNDENAVINAEEPKSLTLDSLPLLRSTAHSTGDDIKSNTPARPAFLLPRSPMPSSKQEFEEDEVSLSSSPAVSLRTCSIRSPLAPTSPNERPYRRKGIPSSTTRNPGPPIGLGLKLGATVPIPTLNQHTLGQKPRTKSRAKPVDRSDNQITTTLTPKYSPPRKRKPSSDNLTRHADGPTQRETAIQNLLSELDIDSHTRSPSFHDEDAEDAQKEYFLARSPSDFEHQRESYHRLSTPLQQVTEALSLPADSHRRAAVHSSAVRNASPPSPPEAFDSTWRDSQGPGWSGGAEEMFRTVQATGSGMKLHNRKTSKSGRSQRDEHATPPTRPSPLPPSSPNTWQHHLPSPLTWRASLLPEQYESLHQRYGHQELQRQEVIWDLCQSEHSFVQSLRVVLRLFVQPLRTTHGTLWIPGLPKNVTRLFDWLDDIVHLHSEIDTEFQTCWTVHFPLIVEIAEIFLPFVRRLEMYQPYLARLETVMQEVESMLRDPRDDFGEFLRIQMASPECRAIPLRNYLMRPIQRLMKYPLFFKQLWELTPRSHPDHVATFSLLHATDTTIRVLQEVKAREDEYDLIKSLAGRIKGLPSGLRLATRERRLIAQGHLQFLQISDQQRAFLARKADRQRLPQSGLVTQPSNLSKLSPIMRPQYATPQLPPHATPHVRSCSAPNRPESAFSEFSATPSDVTSEMTMSSNAEAFTRPDSIASSCMSTMEPSNGAPRLHSSSLRVSSTGHAVTGTPLYAFIFTDFVLLTQIAEQQGDLRSLRREAELMETFRVLPEIGMSRILGVSDQSNTLGLEHVIAVDLVPIPQLTHQATTGQQPQTTAAAIYLTPSDGGNMAFTSMEMLADARRKWTAAFEKCFQHTLRSISFPGRGFNRRQVDLDVASILAAGLPLPKSPSQQLRAESNASEVDVVEQEREERGWWSLRFQQILREMQDQRQEVIEEPRTLPRTFDHIRSPVSTAQPHNPFPTSPYPIFKTQRNKKTSR